MRPLQFSLLGIILLAFVLDSFGNPSTSLDDAIAIFSQNLANSESETRSPAVPVEVPDLTEHDAEQFLDQIGFNSTTDDGDELGEAKNKILQYQKLYGLPETGELCQATKISLKRPRCGVSDVASQGQEDYKWTKNVLTYYVRNFPAGVAPATVKQLVRNAFDQWSTVTNLDFIESENPNADIELVFGGRHHPDRWQSCGSELGDSTLAHAFFPTVGAIHFNTKFYFGSQNEDDFFNTAMHEIGHALGLEHSMNPASIMYPTLVARFNEIPEIDAEKIQHKYGRREQFTSTPQAPAFCSLSKYDAVFHDQNGEVFFVAGKYYYSNKESSDMPNLSSAKWPGVPDHLDAAVFMNSHAYMFRGDEVWAFVDDKLQLGYPRKIRKTFPGIPKNLDAITHYKNKYVFAFKNEHFWRYNTAKKMVDHSGEVGEFGIPGQIDAAAYDEQRNVIVFYKGDMRYVYNCDTLQTVPESTPPYGC